MLRKYQGPGGTIPETMVLGKWLWMLHPDAIHSTRRPWWVWHPGESRHFSGLDGPRVRGDYIVTSRGPARYQEMPNVGSPKPLRPSTYCPDTPAKSHCCWQNCFVQFKIEGHCFKVSQAPSCYIMPISYVSLTRCHHTCADELQLWNDG